MNLVDTSWIPVVDHHGKKLEISLKELFTGGKKYADLSVRPHERVALMRLFICIAQAALDGPEDWCAWEEALDDLPKAADKYLEKWKGSFDLYSKENPFLQVANLAAFYLKKDTPPPASKMDFSMANGVNSTLFDHKGDDDNRRSLSDSRLLISMLSFMNFSTSGTASNASWDKDKITHTGALAAPCVSKMMYHTFLRGKSVFESICSNILTKEVVLQQYGKKNWGKPIWEMFPEKVNDKERNENASQTYLGRLVPLSRYIKIIDNKNIRYCKGIPIPSYVDAQTPFRCPEPSATSTLTFDKKNKPIRGLLGANHSKAIWRQLPGLLVKRNINEIGGALALGNISEEDCFDIIVCAFLYDPDNTASVEDYIDSTIHISSNFNSLTGIALYEKEIHFVEKKEYWLRKAVQEWRKNIDGDWVERARRAKNSSILVRQLTSIATTHYWTAVEKQLPLLMAVVDALGNKNRIEKLREDWRKKVHQIALDSYSVACGKETPRQIRAFVLGLRRLKNFSNYTNQEVGGKEEDVVKNEEMETVK